MSEEQLGSANEPMAHDGKESNVGEIDFTREMSLEEAKECLSNQIDPSLQNTKATVTQHTSGYAQVVQPSQFPQTPISPTEPLSADSVGDSRMAFISDLQELAKEVNGVFTNMDSGIAEAVDHLQKQLDELAVRINRLENPTNRVKPTSVRKE